MAFMKELKISKQFKLPISTVTQKLAFLGTTGSGKTYGASKLAEEFWSIGAQFVVLDPVGVWYGLRLAKDGKKPSSINIPIFGGLHGDVPLESTGGELLANLIVDKGLSCIIDVSQFESETEKAHFALNFANKLFFRKKSNPSAIHLFLEECQEFVPQNPQKGEERMLHAFVRMQKLGRNFGIGSSYISQRPQEVNKKALNMCQTLFVFRTTGTHERTAIEKWIEDKSLDESIANDLPKIPTGDCHVWSPEFLKISEMAHISEKETFNASATPEVGAVAKARHLAPIDLDKVRSEMAATIEKAKSEDPRFLRQEISKLKGELVSIGKKMPTNLTDIKVIEKAVKDTERKMNITFMAERDEFLRHIKNMFKIIETVAHTVKDIKMPDLKIRAEQNKKYQKIFKPTTDFYGKSVADIDRPRLERENREVDKKLNEEFNRENKPLSKCAQMIASYLLKYGKKTKTQIAVATGYSRNSGGFSNSISELRAKGILMEDGNIFSVYADHFDKIPEIEVNISLEKWIHKLSACSRKIWELMLTNTDTNWPKDKIADDTGYSATSGGFSNSISELSALGLIERLSGSLIRVNPEILEL